MKRFFCRKCQKIKRVRKFPKLITDVTKLDPSLRVGEYNSHKFDSRSEYLKYIKVS